MSHLMRPRSSRWMPHLQLAQLGSKQWSCPRTVLPISVGIGTIRAVQHLAPRDIVLDAAVRDGEQRGAPGRVLSSSPPRSSCTLSSPRARLASARRGRRGAKRAWPVPTASATKRRSATAIGNDRQRPSATIGNGHRQRSAAAIGNDRQRGSAAAIGNDRQRPSATTGSAADQGDGAASKVAQRTLIESAWSVTATSWTLAVFHGSTSEE